MLSEYQTVIEIEIHFGAHVNFSGTRKCCVFDVSNKRLAD